MGFKQVALSARSDVYGTRWLSRSENDNTPPEAGTVGVNAGQPERRKSRAGDEKKIIGEKHPLDFFPKGFIMSYEGISTYSTYTHLVLRWHMFSGRTFQGQRRRVFRLVTLSLLTISGLANATEFTQVKASADSGGELQVSWSGEISLPDGRVLRWR